MRPTNSFILANLVVLLLLNYAVALSLYAIKGIPLMEDGALLAALGSGLLLFMVSGTVPLMVLLIARLRHHDGKWAIIAIYLLTVLVGGVLSYGAFTTMWDVP